MERLLRVCVVLLAVTIVIGSYSIVKLHGISSKLAALSGSQDGYQFSYLSSELSRIAAVVGQMKADAAFVSPIEVTVGQALDDAIPVYLGWQVRQMSPDSTAVLYVRSPQEVDYVPYDAENVGGGGFRAAIQVPFEMDPRLLVTFTGPPASSGMSTPQPDYPIMNDSIYEYYISVESGETYFTTDVDSVDLSKVILP